jgi:hypothetical protein
VQLFCVMLRAQCIRLSREMLVTRYCIVLFQTKQLRKLGIGTEFRRKPLKILQFES